MERGNFHLIFTRRCPRTFCSTLRYHAIFEGTIEEASSHSSADLSYIHLETPAEAIYRSGRARDIQSVRSSYSQDDRYSWFIVLFYYYSRYASQLRSSYSLPRDVVFSRSRINTYTYQRWFIRVRPTRSTDARDPWLPGVTASSFSFSFSFSRQSIWWESTGGRKYRGRSFILVRR